MSQRSVSGTDSKAAQHRGMVTENDFKVNVAQLTLIYHVTNETVIEYLFLSFLVNTSVSSGW